MRMNVVAGTESKFLVYKQLKVVKMPYYTICIVFFIYRKILPSSYKSEKFQEAFKYNNKLKKRTNVNLVAGNF